MALYIRLIRAQVRRNYSVGILDEAKSSLRDGVSQSQYSSSRHSESSTQAVAAGKEGDEDGGDGEGGDGGGSEGGNTARPGL